MAAAFGSGALFSIVSGMGTPNPVTNAITTGLAFAVFQGGFFMVCTTYRFGCCFTGKEFICNVSEKILRHIAHQPIQVFPCFQGFLV